MTSTFILNDIILYIYSMTYFILNDILLSMMSHQMLLPDDVNVFIPSLDGVVTDRPRVLLDT